MTLHPLPAHGGNMAWAVKTFGRPKEHWIDLSTGISPWAWPVPTPPSSVWHDLPCGDQTALRIAASQYYRCSIAQLLPLAGSQQGIALIPAVVTARDKQRLRVAIPALGYQEHRLAWAAHGHRIIHYHALSELSSLITAGEIDHAVVINPNNPSAAWYSSQDIIDLCTLLARNNRDSVCVIDEAFNDTRPETSVVNQLPQNALVLRSIGKFFGLAGLRVGFAIAHPHWIAALDQLLPLWHINGPALHIAAQALVDTPWVENHRLRLQQHSTTFKQILADRFPQYCLHASDLFITLKGDREALFQLFIAFAQHGVLTRFGEQNSQHAWLRIGLPGEQLSPTLDRIKMLGSLL